MKSQRIKQMLSILLPIALSLSLVTSAFAGGKSSSSSSSSKKQQTGKPINRPKVTAVGGNSITVGPKTYTVDQNTEIFVNGAKATIDAVQVGMEGEVVGGMTPTVARRISVYATNDKSDSDEKKSEDKKKKSK